MTKRVKQRNHVERELFTSGLYGQRVVKSKKSYTRKTKHKNRGE